MKLNHLRQAWAVLLVAASLPFSSCTVQPTRATFRMGEKMQVGSLIYSIVETKWASQLGDMLHFRVPKQRFLLVRMTVTNSGGSEISVPFLTLEDNQNQTYQEEQNGEGVEGWFGFLRTIQAAQTEEGWILFDVAPNAYQLRISAEAGRDEQSLLIDIPFSIDSMSDASPLPRP